MKIEAFVVVNNGNQVASYSVELGIKKAFFYAKHNIANYDGIIFGRLASGDLVKVDYSQYKN